MDIWFTLFVTLVALIVAVGGALLLVGYLGTLPASFDHGWRVWVPTVLLPIAGPLWFARRQSPEFNRPGLQLLLGVVLLVIAGALLLGLGPYFVERMMPGVK